MIRKKKKKSGNSVPLHREQRCELLVSMMVANVYLLPRPCPWESWVEPAGTSLEGSKSAEVMSQLWGVWTRVNIAGLRRLSLERLAPKVGPWLANNFLHCYKTFPKQEGLNVLQLLVQTMRLLLNTWFPSASLRFWYMLGRGALRNQPPGRAPRTEPLWSSPGGHTLHACHSSMGGGGRLGGRGGIQHGLCISTERERLEAWS